jgi:moderate conductance mechanosensitive channel
MVAVDLTIPISYEVDVDRAIDLINQVGQQMLKDPNWQAKILELPEVLGIDNLDSKGLTLRVWIKTQPLQQWTVGRDFRRRLKLAFDQQGIAIGVP